MKYQFKLVSYHEISLLDATRCHLKIKLNTIYRGLTRPELKWLGIELEFSRNLVPPVYRKGTGSCQNRIYSENSCRYLVRLS